MKLFTLQHFSKILIALSVLLSFANHTYAVILFENFDNPSVAATNNNGVTITYPSGAWFTNGITKPANATENDRIIGLYSQRMRGLDAKNLLQMNFDKAGAGVLSFKYASYSSHSNGEFTIQKSTNGGSSWEQIGSAVVVPKWSGTFLTYTLPVNYDGNIRFRLVVTLRTPNNPNEQFNVDDFMITDFGTEQVAMPVSNVSTGVYESTQNIQLSSATSGAAIYYTTDGTTPTSASSIYSAPFSVSSTTLIRTFAVAAGKTDSREESVLISFPENISSLATFTAKLNATAGTTNINYFKYTGEAVISLAYSTSTTAAYGTTVTKYAFLQDNTAGVSLKDNFKNLSSSYNTRDKVTNIIAQVFNINSTVQLYPAGDFTVISTGNNIKPQVTTLENIASKVYQFVQINDVFFDGADGIKTFGVNNSYFLREGTNAVSTIPVRIPSNLSVSPDYQGKIIPAASQNIAGIVSKSETSFTGLSVFVRKESELNVDITGIQTVISKYITISGNTLIIDSPETQQVRIYNAGGQLLSSFTTNMGANKLELAKGVYVIRIGDKAAKVLL
jgi:hypothetical protein